MRMIPSDVYQNGVEAVLKFLRDYLPGKSQLFYFFVTSPIIRD